MVRHLPDGSANCLDCACANPDNVHATRLLHASEALTSTGVLAAVFVATSDEHSTLVRLARAAIMEQRDVCDANGHSLRRRNCWRNAR